MSRVTLSKYPPIIYAQPPNNYPYSSTLTPYTFSYHLLYPLLLGKSTILYEPSHSCLENKHSATVARKHITAKIPNSE